MSKRPEFARIAAWAAEQRLVIVDRTEWEEMCGSSAAMMAEQADADLDFDRFLLSL